MSNKTHWKKAFNSDYLGSCDVDEKDIIATIKNVRLQEVKSQRGKETCNVAHFVEPNLKPMILNVTNSKVVKKFAGSRYIEDWNNIPVSIYVDKNVKMAGEITEGLRIRTQQPKVGKPELTPNSDKWEGAVAYVAGGDSVDNITKKYSLTEENLKKLLEEAGVENS